MMDSTATDWTNSGGSWTITTINEPDVWLPSVSDEAERRWWEYCNRFYSVCRILEIRDWHNQTLKPIMKSILSPFLARKSLIRISLKTRFFNMRFRGRRCLNL